MKYFFLLFLILGSCSYSRQNLMDDLKSIKTSADEIKVFNTIYKSSRVHISFYDKNGIKDDGTNRSFKAISIAFHQFGEPPIKYTPLDYKNVFILMRE